MRLNCDKEEPRDMGHMGYFSYSYYNILSSFFVRLIELEIMTHIAHPTVAEK